MKSRLYVNEYSNPKIIEYFDYDLIQHGNNKLYKFNIEEEEYHKLKRTLGFYGYDDDVVSLFGREFGEYGDWDKLKCYLDEHEITYSLKKLTLNKEKRAIVQKEQFSLRDKARISSYIRHGLSVEEVESYLNEYEMAMYKDMLKNNDLIEGDSDYYSEHEYYPLQERED